LLVIEVVIKCYTQIWTDGFLCGIVTYSGKRYRIGVSQTNERRYFYINVSSVSGIKLIDLLMTLIDELNKGPLLGKNFLGSMVSVYEKKKKKKDRKH
jgi:hypothetical protein